MSSNSSRCSGTCTPTCTTRRCGCSTRASPAIEIAETIELPPALEKAWHTHGYYGSVSHNVKAIYQRYMGWFDGNPAQLWQHPPEEAAQRYVEFMGGADAVVAKARASFDDGDFRWVAEVLNHVVFADEAHDDGARAARRHLEQLGYGAENGTWRNFYLPAPPNCGTGNFGTPVSSVTPDILAALTRDAVVRLVGHPGQCPAVLG